MTLEFPRYRTALAGCLLAASPFLAQSAAAHQAGDWLLKFGVTQVKPDSDNGSVLGGTVDLDASDNVEPSISLTWMATRHIGIELLGALPFEHDIRSHALGGKIATTKQLPPTLSVQWHFLPTATVQPYVGVGVNYTRFFDTDTKGALSGSRLVLEDSFGLAGQVGVHVPFNEGWFINADVRYADIDTEVNLNSSRIGTANIDPWVTTVGFGLAF